MKMPTVTIIWNGLEVDLTKQN